MKPEDPMRRGENEAENRPDGFWALGLESRGYTRIDPPFSYEVESSSTPGKMYNCEVLGWKLEEGKIIVIGWEYRGSEVIEGNDGWGRSEAQRRDNFMQLRRSIDEFPPHPRLEEIRELAAELKNEE